MRFFFKQKTEYEMGISDWSSDVCSSDLIDANSGVYRFTGDNIHLTDGIQFVVLVLGLFSISEILLLLEKTHRGQEAVKATGRMMFNVKEAASAIGRASGRERVCQYG